MIDLGRLYMTRGVARWLEYIETVVGPSSHRRSVVSESIGRHRHGDWGEVDLHDRAANDRAAANGDERILSAYTIDGRKVWIITEADRSATTVLFPEEEY